MKIKENSLVTCPLPHGGGSVRKGPRSEGGNGLGWLGWSLLHPVPEGVMPGAGGQWPWGAAAALSALGEISKHSLDTSELGTACTPDA